MVRSEAILILLTISVTLVQVYAFKDSCYCVSASYGCKEDNRQMGYCEKRCCADSQIDPTTGEKVKRECKCFNASRCPTEYPKANGQCHDLVECCPPRTDL